MSRAARPGGGSGRLSGFDPGLVWEYRGALAEALLVTLQLAVVASVAGVAMGTLLAAGERLAGTPGRVLVSCYVEVFRNTPLLVQLMWIHFALPMLTGIATTPMQSGLLTLSLSATAYFTEIVRGGIAVVPRGQWEAAASLGLSRAKVMRLVVLPQTLRIMLPPLANMTVSVFKGTTIVSVLSVGELLQVVNRISNYTFKTLEIFTFAAIAYLLIGTLLDVAAKRLEARLSLAGARR